jgi:hypothetical protein
MNDELGMMCKEGILIVLAQPLPAETGKSHLAFGQRNTTWTS